METSLSEMMGFAPVNALGLELDLTPDKLIIRAPLSANVNDKGTVFAGSIYSAAVLAGWQAVNYSMITRGVTASAAVVDSSMKYTRPARETATGEVALDDTLNAAMDVAAETFRAEGKAFVSVQVKVISAGRQVAEYEGKYAVYVHRTQSK